MAITTTINLVADGTSKDTVVVQGQDGSNLPNSEITWSAPHPTTSGITFFAAADGISTNISAATGTTPGAYTTAPIYTGPRGSGAVTGPTLTINITAPLPAVTSLQINETAGS